MFCVEKTFYFEAGHELVYHDGKCRNPHGHSYVFTVRLESSRLIESGPKKNMIIDFDDMAKIVKPMIEQYLDHRWLNDTLNTDSPTAEYIAQWIFRYLYPLLPNLKEITLEETTSARVTYSEKD